MKKFGINCEIKKFSLNFEKKKWRNCRKVIASFEKYFWNLVDISLKFVINTKKILTRFLKYFGKIFKNIKSTELVNVRCRQCSVGVTATDLAKILKNWNILDEFKLK